MASTNRTGRVSSIDYEAGTYEVTYFDRGQSVTRKINAMSNGEYKMPVVGQVVSVTHTSSGLAAATTTGTVWNQTNTPAEGYKGLYRKEYASRKGQAYDRYDENTGVYTQYVDKRTGRNCNGEIYDEAKGPISLVAGGQIQAKSSTSSISLNAKTGVGIVAGTSLSLEAGSFASLEAAGALSISTGGEIHPGGKRGHGDRGGGRRGKNHPERRGDHRVGGGGCERDQPNENRADGPGDQRHRRSGRHHHPGDQPDEAHPHGQPGRHHHTAGLRGEDKWR